jgi:hypothetical protein
MNRPPTVAEAVAQWRRAERRLKRARFARRLAEHIGDPMRLERVQRYERRAQAAEQAALARYRAVYAEAQARYAAQTIGALAVASPHGARST